MRFSSSLPWIAISLLAGCSFDFHGFSPDGAGGAGGAVSTTTAAGPSTGVGPTTSAGPTTSNTSTGSTTATATTSGMTTATTSSTSSTGGAGGGMPDLTPCGGFTDAFDTLDSTKWSVDPAVSNNGGTITATTGPNKHAGLYFPFPAKFTECYASLKLTNFGSAGSDVSLGVSDFVMNSGNIYLVNYNPQSGKASAVPAPSNTSVTATPTHLGIAFHLDQVVLLYADGGGWHSIVSDTRGAWLDNQPPTSHIFFGEHGDNGSAAVFDDFNVRAITIADLP